jgi:hypothetical protein
VFEGHQDLSVSDWRATGGHDVRAMLGIIVTPGRIGARARGLPSAGRSSPDALDDGYISGMHPGLRPSLDQLAVCMLDRTVGAGAASFVVASATGLVVAGA